MIRDLALTLRDKKVLLIGSLGLVLLLLTGILVTAGTALGRLDRSIAARSEALRDMGQLRNEAQALQQKIRQQEEKLAKMAGGSLVTVVEGLTNQIAGKGNLAYLRPVAAGEKDGLMVETLELKLERQSLEQVVRLLWEVENSPAAPMRVASLRLQRRFENHALLDMTMNVTAYRK